MSSTKDRLINYFKAEARGIATLAQRTASTKAYIYPIFGLKYFITHRELWSPLTSRLLPLSLLSTAVVTAMFIFTYIPQSFVLQFVNGPLAWITTIPLVLSESATIISVIARGWLLEESLVDVFDAVLMTEGGQKGMSLVQSAREVHPGSSSGSSISRLGHTLRKPIKSGIKHISFSPVQVLKNYLLLIPVNFIPVVGPFIFLTIQARKLGPTFHSRYFQLKSMSEDERERWVRRNKEGYLGFGLAAMGLGFVPVLGIVFAFSNMVGAAVWAAEIEKGEYIDGQGKKREKAEGSASKRRDSGVDVNVGYEVKKEL